MPRQQGDGLDVDQPGRHFQEGRADLEVCLLHPADIVEVLGQKGADLDVGDLHLMAGDQVQEQLQRPFEVFQMERQCFHQAMSLQSMSIQPVRKSRRSKATLRQMESGRFKKPK